jgi:hypothetical protein
MPASTETEFLYLALQAECLGRSAEAREWLRRVIARDGGPATRDVRPRLGRPAIAVRPNDDEAEAEGALATVRSLDEPAEAMQSAAAIHGLALRRPNFMMLESRLQAVRIIGFRLKAGLQQGGCSPEVRRTSLKQLGPLWARHRYDPAYARQPLDESPEATEIATPRPAHAR